MSETGLDAYHHKTRRQRSLTMAACVLGGAFLVVIADHRSALLFALASIAAIAAVVALQGVLSRHANAPVDWPWAAAGALSVGPAFSVGLHSGFAAIVASLLFLGGLFRASHLEASSGRRAFVLGAICVAYAIVFTLLYTGAIPDVGNVPVFVAGGTRGEALAQHLLLQGVFVAAWIAGTLVDRRYEALTREIEAAARRTEADEAALASVRADIERALAGEHGLFEGEHVGPYQLRRLLGRGGMGDVYDAVDASGARVAVKLLRRERATDSLALSLFAKEADTLARVRSDHVARVLAAGGLEGLDADVPYLAMEYLEGETLAAILARGRLPLPEVATLVRDLASGLRDIHGAGIVHRDLKPQNIIAAGPRGPGPSAPCWKIVDFGVAQLHDLVASPATQAGTPQYMAPEQALGERVDARADLYALSLIAYHALTGRPAFTGRDRRAIAEAARAHGPPHPGPEVPEPVALALRLGLAALPGDRYSTAAELAATFAAAFAGRLDDDRAARARALLARAPWSGAPG